MKYDRNGEVVMENPLWFAVAEYADGTYIEEYFPYMEHDSYSAECDRQYELESWLIERHDGCTYYSVGVCEAD